MRKPLSTITKARTGAQTIGSLTVSVILAARNARGDVRGDAEGAPSCSAELLPYDSLPVVSNERKRIVIGTTVRLMTRLPTAIGMAALGRPNKSPRTAGPTKGTAGAEAVSAHNALMPIDIRNAIRDNRKIAP